MPADTSFFKGPKAALEAINEMLLKEDQKHLFEKCFDLVEKLVLAGHKVISELIYHFILFSS